MSSCISKKNMFSCSHVFQKNMSSCSHVFQKKHVLMFPCLSKKTCPHVLMSFKKKTCPHVLMSFKKKHVLMFPCLSKKTCPHVLMSFKKTMFFCSSVFSKTCSHVSTCPHSKIKDTFIQLKFSFCVII